MIGLVVAAEKVGAVSKRSDGGNRDWKKKSRVVEAMKGHPAHDAADEKALNDKHTKPQPT